MSRIDDLDRHLTCRPVCVFEQGYVHLQGLIGLCLFVASRTIEWNGLSYCRALDQRKCVTMEGIVCWCIVTNRLILQLYWVRGDSDYRLKDKTDRQ